MRIFSKLVRRIALAAVLLLIVAAAIVYFNLNRIVRRTIEVQATNSLNVPTTVDSVRLSLLGGSFSLDDLQIASPGGFASPHLLFLDGADINVSYGQLRQEPIHISSVVLEQPRLVVEQAGGKLNLKALMEQMPRSESELRVIIDTLKVQNATVVLRPGLPGLQQELAVAVPSLELTNIGTGQGAQNGVAIKQVVLQTATALAARASQGNIPEQLQALLKTDLKGIADQLGSEAKKKIDELTKPLEQILPGAGKDVSNLIGSELDKALGGRKRGNGE